VSLSKEDISRPATTLLQSDIIRCGADTTSPFNGEEAPPVSSTSDVPTSDDNDSNSQSFVFGENLEDRAVFINKRHEINDNINSNDNNSNNLSHKRLKIDEELKNNSEEISKTDSNTGEQNCNDFKASTSASSDADLSSIKTTPDGVLDLSANSDSGDKSENKRKYEVITGEEGIYKKSVIYLFFFCCISTFFQSFLSKLFLFRDFLSSCSDLITKLEIYF
jgi:hypothetical protein